MAKRKATYNGSIVYFTPKKIEKILDILKRIQRLPALKPIDKKDCRKVSERNVRYISSEDSEYVDKREVYGVMDIGLMNFILKSLKNYFY